MKILNKISIIFVSLILVSAILSASMIIPSNEKAKENSNAPENSPIIGKDWNLERVDFIHYAKPQNPGKPSKTDNCYKLMGVKWLFPEGYFINALNSKLEDEFVFDTISTSANTWDDETSIQLFTGAELDETAVYGVYDNKNSIDFNVYPNTNVIAVTSVWYTRVGKQIVEFDMRFNTLYSWGDATQSSSVMDLQNIATHELGHAVGMADIYSTGCSEVTMYGYSNYGETSKRTLEQPDIIGLQRMYGE